MKKILGLLLTIFACNIFAEEMASVPVSQLTAQQKVSLGTQTAVQTFDTISEYAVKFRGLGKEVGSAMKEGLNALSGGVNDFAKTDAGKYTAFIIAWKIMFKDILQVGNHAIRFFVGFFILITFFIAIVWSYKRTCLPSRILKSEKKDLGDNGRVRAIIREYTIINDDQDEDHQQGRQILHAVFLVILILAVGMIMFF